MKNKGITMIALVITIVIMLILATVAVNVSINGGLFDYSRKAKLKTEITELQERLMKKQIINEGQTLNGTINEILEIKSDYNDKLGIEDGELVYVAEKWDEKDIEFLEEIGINESKFN